MIKKHRDGCLTHVVYWSLTRTVTSDTWIQMMQYQEMKPSVKNRPRVISTLENIYMAGYELFI